MIKVAQVPLSGPAVLRNWTIDSMNHGFNCEKLPLRTAPSAGRSLHLAPCLYCSLGVFAAVALLVEGLPLLIV